MTTLTIEERIERLERTVVELYDKIDRHENNPDAHKI